MYYRQVTAVLRNYEQEEDWERSLTAGKKFFFARSFLFSSYLRAGQACIYAKDAEFIMIAPQETGKIKT